MPNTEPLDPGRPRPLPSLPTAWRSLGSAFVATARGRPKAAATVDSLGQALDYGDLLLRAVAAGRAIARDAGKARYVGVLMPPSTAGVVANVALTLLGRVPVNLNYTAGPEAIASAVAQCKIGHVITSKRALAKLKLDPPATPIYLEDLPKKVTKADQAFAFLAARVVPLPLLGAMLPGVRAAKPDEPATVIFTSGSTGDPKGVILSHQNVLSNVHQIREHLDLDDREVVLGVLPFFHSFGFTVTIWTVLVSGFLGVYHVSPLDARVIGNLCEEHGATIQFSTPTFLRGLAARCGREQFAKMRLTVVGAEKLKPEVAAEALSKLGIEAMEGYGCTETGPVVAVNVPQLKSRPGDPARPGHRPGTVGIPLPGTAVKTVDPETGADLAPGEEGLIHVRGPQVMAGYLNRPEATAKVLRDGWYDTGDIGKLDADGFLHVTDRLSRFAKIGGEMVPLRKIEAAILEAAGADEAALAVVAVPDPKRGERIVVLHAADGIDPEAVGRALASKDFPRLWVPAADDYRRVEAIPMLGTGKPDLRALKLLATSSGAQAAQGTPTRHPNPSPQGGREPD